ncbi:MAG: mandelate racemase/muconate lactonizing enzyme family protein [Vallitaleaceae bacterium]|nr:mandelate racemase/muconate lactonizing enzyme family protein [Vallitaleaceae bacterium]
MKIQSVETIVVKQELGKDVKFCFSQAWYNTRTIMILKITTDTGIVGWGESFGPAFVNQVIVDKYYTPYLIGQDPLDIEVIWEGLYNILRDHCTRGNAIEAMSSVDIALWDIKGKFFNQPIYKLLGGSPRKGIRPYATGLYRNVLPTDHEGLIKEALRYKDDGFKAIKIKIGFGVKDDIKTVKAIRKAVGDEILLMVDANHAYNASTALKVCRGIEECDITWLEEPVPPEDIEGYIEVKSKTTIPIAGGETEFTRFGFSTLLNRRAVDIIQPDCGVTGGISEFKKIAVLASINNIQCYPHVWGSAIALYTGIHCAFSLQDFPNKLVQEDMLLEYDRTENFFRECLNKDPLVLVDGYIMPPTKPGLGIEVDEELIAKYRIS